MFDVRLVSVVFYIPILRKMVRVMWYFVLRLTINTID